jgi:hypothetical protein
MLVCHAVCNARPSNRTAYAPPLIWKALGVVLIVAGLKLIGRPLSRVLETDIPKREADHDVIAFYGLSVLRFRANIGRLALVLS